MIVYLWRVSLVYFAWTDLLLFVLTFCCRDGSSKSERKTNRAKGSTLRRSKMLVLAENVDEQKRKGDILHNTEVGSLLALVCMVWAAMYFHISDCSTEDVWCNVLGGFVLGVNGLFLLFVGCMFGTEFRKTKWKQCKSAMKCVQKCWRKKKRKKKGKENVEIYENEEYGGMTAVALEMTNPAAGNNALLRGVKKEQSVPAVAGNQPVENGSMEEKHRMLNSLFWFT